VLVSVSIALTPFPLYLSQRIFKRRRDMKHQRLGG
jgi:hypothetical protein